MPGTVASALKKYRYLLVVSGLLVLGAWTLFAEPPPRPLTWSAAGLAPTVVAGTAPTTTTVSFTVGPKLPLPDAEVQLSSNLSGFVSVSPTHLGTVKQDQTVTLTLTVSVPASTTPAVIPGSIQVQKANPKHEVYGSPLALTLDIQWPHVTSPLVTVNYPPALAAQGGLIGQPEVSAGSDAATYVDIPLSTGSNPPLPLVRIAINPNSSSQTLPQWFEDNIDTNGILLQSGSYTSHTFQDGKVALVDTAPAPPSFDGSSVNGYAYIISPKGKYIASITLMQDKTYLYQLGYNTPAAMDGLLQDLTATLTFNE
jgi:hypothetical protein